MIASGFKRFAASMVDAPERLYLIVALVAVVAFALITPPFQGPDEESHYIRTQYIAHGYFIPVNVQKSSAALPESIAKVAKITFYTDDLRGQTGDKYELYRTREALRIPLNKADTYKPPMITYSFLPYLPAVPGIFLANLFRLNPLISLYIARVSLGIASAVVIFYAIKLLPGKKWLAVGIGLLPMLLFQQSVVSSDGFSYALLFLFAAYTMHLYALKGLAIRKDQWIKLALICLAVALAKPLLYLFLPLVIILARNKKDFIRIGGIIVASVLAIIALSISGAPASGDEAVAANLPANVSSAAQLTLLEHRPLHGLRVAWNTYMTTYGDEQFRGIVGIFGAADTAYPMWMFTLYAIVLGLLALIRTDADKIVRPIKRKWKMLAVGLSLVYFTLVDVALYLGFTPVNYPILYGVQGRYFIPTLIILAVFVFTGGLRLALYDGIRLKKGVAISLPLLVLLALFVTYQRYFLFTP